MIPRARGEIWWPRKLQKRCLFLVTLAVHVAVEGCPPMLLIQFNITFVGPRGWLISYPGPSPLRTWISSSHSRDSRHDKYARRRPISQLEPSAFAVAHKIFWRLQSALSSSPLSSNTCYIRVMPVGESQWFQPTVRNRLSETIKLINFSIQYGKFYDISEYSHYFCFTPSIDVTNVYLP